MFYGEWEIKTIEDATEQGVKGKKLSFLPEKDTEGNELPVTDLFVPLINYEPLISEELVAWDKHFNIKFKPIAKDIINVLKMYNVFIGSGNGVKSDVAYLFEHIIEHLSQEKNRFFNTAWGVPPHVQTMLQLDKHLSE